MSLSILSPFVYGHGQPLDGRPFDTSNPVYTDAGLKKLNTYCKGQAHSG